jgi:hypothetical protein
MSEEKKGRLKMTFEVEVNEQFMDVLKDAIAKMPQMMAKRAEAEK